jgi:chromosome segregation ATPase
MTTILTKRIQEKEERNLQKELNSLKIRHEQLLESYKELFKEKRELEEKIEFLQYVLKR